MSITRIAPERCSIACSPGSEQGRRSRSRGRSTTAFTPDWTSGRRFGLLDEARAPNGGRPTLRAGIVVTLPRWTRCRLRLKPAVRASLDLTTIPARCPGRRGHAPHESASPLAGFCTLGRSAIRGSPWQHIDPTGAGHDVLGGGLDALAPHHVGVVWHPYVTGLRPVTARLRLANQAHWAALVKWPMKRCV